MLQKCRDFSKAKSWSTNRSVQIDFWKHRSKTASLLEPALLNSGSSSDPASANRAWRAANSVKILWELKWNWNGRASNARSNLKLKIGAGFLIRTVQAAKSRCVELVVREYLKSVQLLAVNSSFAQIVGG